MLHLFLFIFKKYRLQKPAKNQKLNGSEIGIMISKGMNDSKSIFIQFNVV